VDFATMVSIQESANFHNPRDEGEEGEEGDEKTHEAVPRDGHDKTERAVEVMRNLDIKRVFVLKVLKKLHKVREFTNCSIVFGECDLC
jgi:hypothetical protein